MYQFIRTILFLFDPEWVHYFSMNTLRLLCKISFAKRIISNQFLPKGAQLQKQFLGINFKNPVGLGAGFDKNARYLNELEALGFGFVEIGTVTPKPQAGNDKPRLFRLPKDKALINRMGFNNDGVAVIVQRLIEWRKSPITNHQSKIIIGGNIGKNKITPNEGAWKDYATCFKALHPYVDYFVVNVSSPNTPGLRELQEKDSLRKILVNLQQMNLSMENSSMDNDQSSMEDGPTVDHGPWTTEKQETKPSIAKQENEIPHSPFTIHHSPKPILLKIAPDLTTEQIDDVIDLALEIKLDGIVAANTTIDRSNLKTSNSEQETIGAGGLSGLPAQKRSTEIVQYINQKTNGQIPVIASGGIFTAADANAKFAAGASLVQVWTGFIYEGPAIVKNICSGL